MKTIYSLFFFIVYLPCYGAERPNIILINADDLGYGDIGVYGGHIATPSIDTLGKEGIQLTHCYASSPVCSPSRAALLSGCYAQRISIRRVVSFKSDLAIHPDEKLLPEILKEVGYSTAMVGKWHLGHRLDSDLPRAHGFDSWFGSTVSNGLISHDGVDLTTFRLYDDHKNQTKLIEIAPDMNTITQRYTERAVRFLRRNHKAPFFLYLAHNMPHTPLGVSSDHKGKSGKGLYADVIQEIDWSTGEILKELKSQGIEDNTIVIFTADNGPWLIFGNHGGTAGPLSGGKKQTLEGGMRVPCLVRWPKRIPAGIVSDELTSQIDLLPTLAVIAGGKLPEHRIDGFDISRLLFGETEQSTREYFCYYYRGKLQAIRYRKWKLRLPHTDRDAPDWDRIGFDSQRGHVKAVERKLALFDLVSDPAENYDLSQEHAELVKTIQAYAQEVRKDLGDLKPEIKGQGVRPSRQKRGSDNRNIAHGDTLLDAIYSCQPYIVTLDDGTWFCVLTEGTAKEGKPGQHLVFVTSNDKGKNWSAPSDIEPADGPAASWVVPFLVPAGPAKGRIYVFYTYNGDDLKEVRRVDGSMTTRLDTLGYFAYKYTDDKGSSWSKRHYLPIRTTAIDRANAYQGAIKFFWGVSKPQLDGKQFIMGFSKVGGFGEGWLASSEGWFFRCDNILDTADPDELVWQMLPGGNEGLKAPEGVICEEHNLTVLSDGSFYATARTTQGRPVHYYSRDRGNTWSQPEYIHYANGRKLVHPRCFCPVKRLNNGKYLLWFHNNSGRDYMNRNPVWVCGGVERDSPEGKVIDWSEPEILLYSDNLKEKITYPDFVESNGELWITETNKVTARVHQIDSAILEGAWDQFDKSRGVTARGLVYESSGPALKKQKLPKFNFFDKGAAIDVRFSSPDRCEDYTLLSTIDSSGKGWRIRISQGGKLSFHMNDGGRRFMWTSDPSLINHEKTNHLTFIIDPHPGIFSVVHNGQFHDCSNNLERTFGWARFQQMDDVSTDITPKGMLDTIARVRVYNRYLRTAEAIANYRNDGILTDENEVSLVP